MSWIATAILGSWYARAMVAVLVGFIALKGYGYVKKQQGRAELVNESREVGKIAGQKSELAHAEAEKPGAFERLLKSSCRDCR